MSAGSYVTLADGVLATEGGKQVVRFQRRLAHPIERVWAALTEPGELLGWWGEAEVDLVEGGRFTMRWLNADDNGNRVLMHATITRLQPPHLLETEAEPHGLLRWELRPDADGTVLTFSSTLDLPVEYRLSRTRGECEPKIDRERAARALPRPRSMVFRRCCLPGAPRTSDPTALGRYAPSPAAARHPNCLSRRHHLAVTGQ